jgi:xanthine dehydrogenase YagT iron-sulfur-binding subunit
LSSAGTPVAEPAPAFAISWNDGASSLTNDSFAGEPAVVAFFDDVDFRLGLASHELDLARAELRGLGAALLAVSERGIWCFRPDEERQTYVDTATLDAGVLGELRARFCVPIGAQAMFVIDPRGAIRSRSMSTGVVGETTFASLVDALAAAGRAVMRPSDSAFTLTRRELVLDSLAVAFSAALLEGCRPASRPDPPATASGPDVEVALNVNGAVRKLRIDPRVTLLDALRERLGLSGTKKGCDQGQCGACTVLIDNRRVNACLTLAVAVDGAKIRTIEGVATGEALHPLQSAFIAEDGFQCGYCTSGQIMSALGLLAEHRAESGSVRRELAPDEIRERMSGNICRCGAYPNIVAAIQRAQKAS